MFTWDVLFDYIINRPWNKIITINADMLFEIIDSKGIFNNTFFYRSLEKPISFKRYHIRYNFERISCVF